MVRICYRFLAILSSWLYSSYTLGLHNDGRITLELHRFPHQEGIIYNSYQRKLNTMKEEFTYTGIDVTPLNIGTGTHYTWVYAGTPPQRVSVIADTGSELMAFPCSGCSNCGEHTDQPFAAAKSSTLTHVTCENHYFFHCTRCSDVDNTCSVSQAYMEGSSWHATVVQDIVYLGDVNSFNDKELREQFGTRFPFGCQTSETGLFTSQIADGIMGLGNSDSHLVAHLYKEKKIQHKIFSLCFGLDGGSMSLGGIDTARHVASSNDGTKAIQYAKLQRNGNAYYQVTIRDIRINGISIEPPEGALEEGKFIVDSGTTDSYLPRRLESGFHKAFTQATNGELKYQENGRRCSGYTKMEMEKLPTIEYILEGEDGSDMILKVTPDQYIVPSKTKCGTVYLSESSGGVIGANLMTNRDVIFDPMNDRVGFIDADCTFSNISTSAIPTTITPTTTAKVPTTTVSKTSKPKTEDGEAKMCNYNGQTYAICADLTVDTWDYEDGHACVSLKLCSEQSLPYGPIIEPDTKNGETTEPDVSNEPDTENEETTEPDESNDVSGDESDTDKNIDIDTDSTTAHSPKPVDNIESPSPASTEETVVYKEGGKTNVRTDNPIKVHSNVDLGFADKIPDHPLVLTIVGSFVAIAFLAITIVTCRRHRKYRARKKNWSRINDDEFDDNDDLDLDEEHDNPIEDEQVDESTDKDKTDIKSSKDGEEKKEINLEGKEKHEDEEDDDIFEEAMHSTESPNHDTKVLEQL